VRLQLQREGAQLKGTIWRLGGNAWNLTQDRQAPLEVVCQSERDSTSLSRACLLCRTLALGGLRRFQRRRTQRGKLAGDGLAIITELMKCYGKGESSRAGRTDRGGETIANEQQEDASSARMKTYADRLCQDLSPRTLRSLALRESS
jgi:hypothetical protein